MKNSKHNLSDTGRRRRWPGLVIIIVAAILLEALSALQYHYTRSLLQKELERTALTDLVTSALRIQEVLSKAEVAVDNELMHAERNLDNPEYMYTIISNLVANDADNLIGAFVCFKPNYYPKKGYWF